MPDDIKICVECFICNHPDRMTCSLCGGKLEYADSEPDDSRSGEAPLEGLINIHRQNPMTKNRARAIVEAREKRSRQP